jgi:hypothetical protein
MVTPLWTCIGFLALGEKGQRYERPTSYHKLNFLSQSSMGQYSIYVGTYSFGRSYLGPANIWGKEHLVKNWLISTLDKVIYFKGTIFQRSTKHFFTSQNRVEIRCTELSLFSNMLLLRFLWMVVRLAKKAERNQEMKEYADDSFMLWPTQQLLF